MRELSLPKLSAAMIFALSFGSLALLANVDAKADNKAMIKDAIAADGLNKKMVKTGEIKPANSKMAERQKPHTDDDFAKLDGNTDGNISAKEAVKDNALSTQFDSADENHDGLISSEEYAAYKTAMAAKILEAAPAVN